MAGTDRLRFIKFLAVGVLNTLFGYAVYVVLVWVGLAPLLALTLAYIIGVIWNFLTHARLVFQTEGLSRLPLYIAVYAVMYLINRWLLALALGMGINEYLAQGALTLVMVVPTFLGIGSVLTGRVPFLGWCLPGRFGPG